MKFELTNNSNINKLFLEPAETDDKIILNINDQDRVELSVEWLIEQIWNFKFLEE
jgi:hypothetical protein